jgi:pyruvate formate lyase activating enzyme
MTTSERALIFDIKRFAVHDGSGIRTTVFFKGCLLRCAWCQNPEGLEAKQRPMFLKSRCIHCGSCREAAEENQLTFGQGRPSLNYRYDGSWDAVIEACPGGAIVYDSEWYTKDGLLEKIREDKVFFRDTGGVTFSGGEPLFFWEWAAELFKAFKAAGLHTCLDTSLYAPPAAINALMPVTDMWLPDYKAEDDARHQKLTGVSNRIIKKNLEHLVAAKAKLEVRCLVVPGCTDGGDIAARHRYLASIGIPKESIVELEYYDYARSKYLALGMKDTMPPKK